MYIVIVAWIYVVFMMAIMEENAVAGIMTFLLYGLLPVGILFYLLRSGHRKRKRYVLEQQRMRDMPTPQEKQEEQQAQQQSKQDEKVAAE